MLTLAMALADPASAFCGTYVGDGSTPLTNTNSQLVIARSGTSTTLTMFNDYQGDLSTFGLVVPVPEGVDADNVRLADRGLMTKLDGYSQPRLVTYTCDDLYGISDASGATGTAAPIRTGPPPSSARPAPASSSSSSGGCSGGYSSDPWYESGDTGDYEYEDTDTGDGVDVEDTFDLGEYTAWVVDAEGSEGLMAWLDANGFVVDAATAALFDEYIAAGSHFLALRVDLDRMSGNNWLSPLQVGYDAESWGLPIRMGAASSGGVQDLVVYAVTDPDAGRASISNYPETAAPDSDCLADVAAGESVLTWYERKFEDATGLPAEAEQLDGRTGFAWVTEYGWGSGACDPCTSTGPLTTDEVYDLGFPGHYGWYLTRLHLRYTPDAVTQDLSFYTSNITDNTQLRFVLDTWEMEGELPTCASDEAPSGPACYSSEYWARKAEEGESATDVVAPQSTGCGPSGVGLLLAIPVLLRRRR